MDEPELFYRLRGALFTQLEVGCREIGHTTAARVGDEHVNVDEMT
jgi:hypothetical protein